jgi:hypothetical protein
VADDPLEGPNLHRHAGPFIEETDDLAIDGIDPGPEGGNPLAGIGLRPGWLVQRIIHRRLLPSRPDHRPFP